MNILEANYRESDSNDTSCANCDYNGKHRGLFSDCSIFEQWQILGEKKGFNSFSLSITKKHNKMVCNFFSKKVKRIGGYKVDDNYSYWLIRELDMEGRSPTTIIEIVKTKPNIDKKYVYNKIGGHVFVEETTIPEINEKINLAKKHLNFLENHKKNIRLI